MHRKIDKNLWYSISCLSNKENDVECLVYSYNIIKTKQYIQNHFNVQTINEYPFISALGINIKAKDLSKIAKYNLVSYIASQSKVFAQTFVAKKVSNIDKLLQEGWTGKGVNVCVIDTGISSHLDFLYPTNRLILFKDFVNNVQENYDDNGHGTFVADVLGGSGLCSGGKYSGIAPQVNIISLKVLNERGETGAFKVLEAMQWIYDNYKKYNISVVCMSFGSSPLESGDPLTIGAEALWNNGITVVCAAGNSGPSAMTIKSPGISRKIITVGAIYDGRNENDEIVENKIQVADFSSRGPSFNYYKPDLVASGVNLNSLQNDGSTLYTKMSGTSVSTPIVAGVCCLLKQKYPLITPSQIKSILIQNCMPIVHDRNVEGYGYLKINNI